MNLSDSSSPLQFSTGERDAPDAIVESPVEQIADIVMHSLDDINALLVRRSVIDKQSEPKSASARRLLRKKEPQYNEELLLHPRSELLKSLENAVQDVTARLLAKSEVGSSNIEFQRLLEVNGMTRAILVALRAHTEQAPLAALNLFDESAKTWLGRTEDATATGSSVPSASGDASGRAPLKSTMEYNEPLPSTSKASCPIETELSSRGLVRASRMELPLFTNWILNTKPTRGESYRLYGCVRSVHLYRLRKKKPFNHEYVVLQFVNTAGGSSWVRLERAAQLARHPYIPRPANFAPFVKGIASRETASFSTSLADLHANSDELATIVIEPPTSATTSSAPLMILEDLGYEIMRTQGANRLYQLFTVNCRWFARRICLNISQWCQNTGVPHVISWRGKTSSLTQIGLEVQKEWFGGGHLEGTKGGSLRVENTLALAVQLLRCNEARTVVRLCEDALALLEAAGIGDPKTRFLMAYTLVTYGDALVMSRGPDVALKHLERACALMSPPTEGWRQLLAHCLSRYASALYDCKRLTDAADRQHECVALTRSLNTVDWELVRPDLAFRLHSLGKYLYELGRISEASDALQEAASHYSVLYPSKSPNYCIPLANALGQWAVTLHRASKLSEAMQASTKATAVLRIHCPSEPGPDLIHHDLALHLHNLGVYTRQTGEPAQSLNIFGEALTLRRELYAIDPSAHRVSLLATLQQCALTCRDLDDPRGAFKYLEEAVILLRKLLTTDPGLYHDELTLTLQNMGWTLIGMARCDDAVSYLAEGIEMERQTFARQPSKHREGFVESLTDYAELLEGVGQLEAALEIREELNCIASASGELGEVIAILAEWHM